jgi:hypothetical protein
LMDPASKLALVAFSHQRAAQNPAYFLFH